MSVEPDGNVNWKSGWFVRNPDSEFETTGRDIRGDLFLEFGALRRDHERIRGFADREGFLGVGCHMRPHTKDGTPLTNLDPGTWIYGESTGMWLDEIEDMRNTLSLWAAIKSGNTARLKAKLDVGRSHTSDWVDDGPNELIHTTPVEYNAQPADGDDEESIPSLVYVRSSELDKSNWPRIGRLFIQEMVTRKLEGATRLGVVHEKRKLVAKTCVDSLLARLWLQFLSSISNSRLKRCAACRELFTAKGRIDQETCSQKCRQRLHLQKQKNRERKGGTRGKKTSKR